MNETLWNDVQMMNALIKVENEIVMNTEGSNHDNLFIKDNTIVWEEGPFEWALNLSPNYTIESFYWNDPDGYFSEAINNYSIALWEV